MQKYKNKNINKYKYMPHSGFKTAQKTINLGKKENNNKDYRSKEKVHPKYTFSKTIIPFDHILRTKYKICLNEKNINCIEDIYRSKFNNVNQNPIIIDFIEHTEEENKIIQNEFNIYFNSPISFLVCSKDKTKLYNSKMLTKNRNKNRDQKIAF